MAANEPPQTFTIIQADGLYPDTDFEEKLFAPPRGKTRNTAGGRPRAPKLPRLRKLAMPTKKGLLKSPTRTDGMFRPMEAYSAMGHALRYVPNTPHIKRYLSLRIIINIQ